MSKSPIKKGIIWNSINNFARYGFMFLGIMILARMLTPHDYGLIGILAIFISIAEILIDSGLGGAIIKKKDAKNIDYSTLAVFNVSVSLFIYAVYFVAAPYVADYYNEGVLTNLIRIYSLEIVIHSFSIVPKVSLVKSFHFKRLSIIHLIAGVGGLCCAIILAYLGFGVYSLAWQYVSSAAIIFILVSITSKYNISFKFSKSSFKEQFTFGFNTTIASTLLNIGENIYSNVIAKTTSVSYAGYYSQAYRLTKVPNGFFRSMINGTFFPVLSQINDEQVFNKRIRGINNKMNAVVIILFGTALPICKEIIIILLGEKWLETEWTLFILLITGIFINLGNVGRNILKCLGHTFVILKNEILLFVISMVLLFITIQLSYKAILLGYLISSILKAIYVNWIAGHYIGYSIMSQVLDLLKVLVPVACAVILSKFITIENIYMDVIIKELVYFCVTGVLTVPLIYFKLLKIK